MFIFVRRRFPCLLLLGCLAGPAQAAAQEASAPEVEDAQSSSSMRFPGLHAAIDAARQRAPAVMIAQASVRVARALHVGARLAPLGNPSAEIIADRGTRNVTRDVALSATLWLPVEPWGQRGKRISEADARVGWASASAETTKAQATAEVIRAYGATIVVSNKVRLLQQILETSKAEAALYRARMQAGDATEQDAAQAAVEVARNAVALSESRADLRKSLTDLARIMGVIEVDEPPPDFDLRPPAGGLHETQSEEVAKRSPAVAMLRQEMKYQASARERWAVEASLPMSLVLTTGRGDIGEWRVGGGLSFTLPFFRKNQGEQAIAEAEWRRAEAEAEVVQKSTNSTLRGLLRERKQVIAALTEIDSSLEPAGKAAVDAAVAVQKAGKGELLRVLTARRDLALLRTRRLEMVLREWEIVSQIAALTGELP